MFSYRISGEISQFKQGMNEVGKTWDYIQDNANVFKPLFCYRKEEPSLDDVMGLFTVSYSVNGSNARTMEDATIYAWELFLQSIEGILLSNTCTYIEGKCTCSVLQA